MIHLVKVKYSVYLLNALKFLKSYFFLETMHVTCFFSRQVWFISSEQLVINIPHWKVDWELCFLVDLLEKNLLFYIKALKIHGG